MTMLAEVLTADARRLRTGVADVAAEGVLRQSRKSLVQVEQAMTDAARESASGFSEAKAPEGLLLALWRVRADAVMVGRALAEPLPATVAGQLAEPAAALIEAMAAELRAGASAIVSGAALELGGSALVREIFERAVESVRQARLTSDMTFDTAARIWGLVFAVESLLANIAELGVRVGEMGQPAAVGVP